MTLLITFKHLFPGKVRYQLGLKNLMKTDLYFNQNILVSNCLLRFTHVKLESLSLCTKIEFAFKNKDSRKICKIAFAQKLVTWNFLLENKLYFTGNICGIKLFNVDIKPKSQIHAPFGLKLFINMIFIFTLENLKKNMEQW